MWKIILLVSLVPPIVVVVLRKWFCDRVVRGLQHGVTNQTGAKLAEHLLRRFNLSEEVELRPKRRSRFVPGESPVLTLSEQDWQGKDVVTLGKVAALVGRAAANRDHAELWNWRDWAVRFGVAFPAFTLLVVVFAVVVAKLTVFLGIVIVVGAFALASLMLLVTMPVEFEAARQAAMLIERSDALPRRADGEEVARCCRAMAWRKVVPGALEWLVGKPGKPGKATPNSLETKTG